MVLRVKVIWSNIPLIGMQRVHMHMFVTHSVNGVRAASSEVFAANPTELHGNNPRHLRL